MPLDRRGLVLPRSRKDLVSFWLKTSTHSSGHSFSHLYRSYHFADHIEISSSVLYERSFSLPFLLFVCVCVCVCGSLFSFDYWSYLFPPFYLVLPHVLPLLLFPSTIYVLLCASRCSIVAQIKKSFLPAGPLWYWWLCLASLSGRQVRTSRYKGDKIGNMFVKKCCPGTYYYHLAMCA